MSASWSQYASDDAATRNLMDVGFTKRNISTAFWKQGQLLEKIEINNKNSLIVLRRTTDK